MPLPHIHQGRNGFGAGRQGVAAAGAEGAARWWVQRAGHIALQQDTAAFDSRVQRRDRREQRFGIGMARCREDGCGFPPVSTIRPRYITATRSEIWPTTARSWVMNRMVRSSLRLISSSRLTICAWIDTSSAETARRRPGIPAPSPASARCRCAGAGRRRTRGGSGRGACSVRPTASSAATTRSSPLLPGEPQLLDLEGRSEDAPDRHARVQGGERVLEDQLHLRGRSGFNCRRLSLRQVLTVEHDAARRSGSVSRSTVRPSVLLPEPDSPTSPSTSPRRIWKETSSTARTD